MIEMSKFILPGILFLLTLISGFWLSLTGRRYNDVSFNIHKLNALSAVILAVIQVWKTPWQVDSFALIVSLLVVAALCVIALFSSGALMSTGKLDYVLMLPSHRIASGALALCCLLTLFGY